LNTVLGVLLGGGDPIVRAIFGAIFVVTLLFPTLIANIVQAARRRGSTFWGGLLMFLIIFYVAELILQYASSGYASESLPAFVLLLAAAFALGIKNVIGFHKSALEEELESISRSGS
jgi:hypothetical protein